MESDGNNKSKALSIALGIFIGLSPFWGFHSVLAIFLAVLFRLNKFLTFIFTQISLPPFIPFIIAASMFTGSLIIENDNHFSEQEFNFEMVKQNLLQYIIGSLIVAGLSATIAGFSFYFLLEYFSNKKKKAN